MCLDAANYKSFKGVPATNLLYNIANTYGTTDTATFKVSYGDETAYIPSLGYRTVRYCNIYNDYNGGSGNCCPRLFDYGGSAVSKNITVSPSTTYTYQIIYKVTSGYTNPNYMYRYEYNGGSYVTESGVHSESNRTSLGDGWWFAWGQFTTQSTTNNLWLTGMWYYQYAVYDKVSVAGVSLHQGTYVIPPEHMLTPQENRGSTVATGGGWADLIGNSNHGTLTNGPLYISDNGGSIVFDSTDDTITFPVDLSYLPALSNFSMEIWMRIDTFPTALSVANVYGNKRRAGVLFGSTYYAGVALYWYGNETGTGLDIFGYIRGADAYRNTSLRSISLNTWTHLVLVNDYSSSKFGLYVNGSLFSEVAGPTQQYDSSLTPTAGNIGISRPQVDGGGTLNYSHLDCDVAIAKIYKNKALTAAEVSQNFNALRGRYGV